MPIWLVLSANGEQNWAQEVRVWYEEIVNDDVMHCGSNKL